jgi:hypothetical protein
LERSERGGYGGDFAIDDLLWGKWRGEKEFEDIVSAVDADAAGGGKEGEPLDDAYKDDGGDEKIGVGGPSVWPCPPSDEPEKSDRAIAV